MESQWDNRAEAGPARDKHGKWLVGFSGNREGKNGSDGRRGRQPWHKRVEYLQSKYDTVRKVASLFIFDVETGTILFPTDELADMPFEDGQIMMTVGISLFGSSEKFKLAANEAYWNRKEGKPVETVYTRNLDDRINEIPSQFATEEEVSRAWEDIIRGRR